jgi:hypothetical protein
VPGLLGVTAEVAEVTPSNLAQERAPSWVLGLLGTTAGAAGVTPSILAQSSPPPSWVSGLLGMTVEAAGVTPGNLVRLRAPLLVPRKTWHDYWAPEGMLSNLM